MLFHTFWKHKFKLTINGQEKKNRRKKKLNKIKLNVKMSHENV